jgi:hypothetical protein
MTIKIENTVDHEDGGATFTFTMSHDEMVEFAQIGMKQSLIDAARDIVEPEPSAPDYYEEVLALRKQTANLKANSF